MKIRRSRILHTIFSILLVIGASGCQREVRSSIPHFPVYYEIDLHSSMAKPLLSPTGYIMITQPDKVYTSIGYGGLLVIHSPEGSTPNAGFYAYDLACPKEAKRDVRLIVNDRLNAECPICHSQFNIIYGSGSPVEGPADTPLLRYHILTSDHRIIIRN